MSASAKRLLAILDTETTGLGINSKIVELSVALHEFDPGTGKIGGILEHYTGLHDPGVPISAEATAVHGIGAADVAGKSLDIPRISEILGKAEAVAAHNADFDRMMVGDLIPEAHTKKWFDTHKGVDWKTEFPDLPDQKLGTLAEKFGINTGTAHRAEADVKATSGLMNVRLPGRNQTVGSFLFGPQPYVAPVAGATAAAPAAKPAARTLTGEIGKLLTPEAILMGGAGIAGLMMARQVLFSPSGPSAAGPASPDSGNWFVNQFWGPSAFDWGRASGFGVSREHVLKNITKEYEEGGNGTQATEEGTRIHGEIQKALMSVNPAAKTEYAIYDPKTKLTGHIDILIPTKVDGKTTMIPTEIKTVEDEEALENLHSIKSEQRAQGQFYLHHLAEQDPDAPPPLEFFIYTPRTDQSKYKIFALQRSETEFQSHLRDYRAIQQEAKQAGLHPQRLDPLITTNVRAKSQDIGEMLSFGGSSVDIDNYEDMLDQVMSMHGKGMKQHDLSNVYGGFHGVEQHSELRKSSGHAMQSPIDYLVKPMFMAADDIAIIYGRRQLNQYVYTDGQDEQNQGGIPSGIRSSKANEYSYMGFEVMNPHPGTDFPGGRIDSFRKLFGLTVGKAEFTETDKAILRNLTTEDVISKMNSIGVIYRHGPIDATVSPKTIWLTKIDNSQDSKMFAIHEALEILTMRERIGVNPLKPYGVAEQLQATWWGAKHILGGKIGKLFGIKQRPFVSFGSHINERIVKEEIRISRAIDPLGRNPRYREQEIERIEEGLKNYKNRHSNISMLVTKSPVTPENVEHLTKYVKKTRKMLRYQPAPGPRYHSLDLNPEGLTRIENTASRIGTI